MIKIAITFLSIILLAAGQIAFACSCKDLTTPEYYSLADEVFLGKVVDIKRTKEDGFTDYVTFQVKTWYKGAFRETAIVATGGSECWFDFSARETYVVYADNTDGKLSTDMCSGTALFFEGNSPEQIKILESLSSYP